MVSFTFCTIAPETYAPEILTTPSDEQSYRPDKVAAASFSAIVGRSGITFTECRSIADNASAGSKRSSRTYFCGATTRIAISRAPNEVGGTAIRTHVVVRLADIARCRARR